MRHLLLAVTFVLTTAAASAHEFWIEPERYEVAPGEPVRAEFRVGQGFEGPSFSWLPAQARRFELVQGEARSDAGGRLGDRPALQQPAPGEGLLTIVYVSTDQRLLWKTWEEFAAFAEHKDAAFALEQHRARGLPEAGFGEAYTRYAKALVAVGDAAGQDQAQDLLVELVAQANPYTDDVSGGLPVQALFEGAPRPGAQVELFDRAPDGTVTTSRHVADDAGVARLPVLPGHVYLADSVVLREPAAGLAAERDVVWESLWASLTFRIPD